MSSPPRKFTTTVSGALGNGVVAASERGKKKEKIRVQPPSELQEFMQPLNKKYNDLKESIRLRAQLCYRLDLDDLEEAHINFPYMLEFKRQKNGEYTVHIRNVGFLGVTSSEDGEDFLATFPLPANDVT